MSKKNANEKYEIVVKPLLRPGRTNMSKKKLQDKSEVKEITHEIEEEFPYEGFNKEVKKVFKTHIQVEITLDLNEPLYMDVDTATTLVLHKPRIISRFQDYMVALGDNCPDWEECLCSVRNGSPEGIKFVENYEEDLA